MTSWHTDVRAALFIAWTDAGLPDPALGLAAHRAAVFGAPAPLTLPPDPGGPLDRELVDRVHGFGVATGRALADVLGLPDDDDTRVAVAWCGRFNLAISLLDHVCDESGRVDALESMEPFHSLRSPTTSDPAPAVEATPEERVVCALAAELLDELATCGLDPHAWRPLVSRLYEAEISTARSSYDTSLRADALQDVLRTKSAGPFELMGLRLAASGPPDALAAAAALGRTVGAAFWLADDAADLWLDLSRGAWNTYLVEVARAQPALLHAPATPFRDAAIARGLRQTDAAARTTTAVVAELQAALAAVPPAPRRTAALASVAAALSIW